MDNAVKFRKKTLSEYNLLTPDANTIYFISDSGRIYLGSTLLGTANSVQRVAELPVASENTLQGIYVVPKEGTTYLTNTIYIDKSNVQTMWPDTQTVYLYGWHGNDVDTDFWPGTAMTETTTQYVLTIPGNPEYIIINNGNVQTIDIDIRNLNRSNEYIKITILEPNYENKNQINLIHQDPTLIADLYSEYVTVVDASNNYKWEAFADDMTKYVQKEYQKGLYPDADAAKLQGIASGAQVNVIEGVLVNNVEQTIANKKVVLDLTTYYTKQETNQQIVNNIENSVVLDSSTRSLSAGMGKVLQDQINSLKSTGRFLSIWNTSTGKPVTDPVTMPYTYLTGDYYLIQLDPTYVPGANLYKPDSSVYTGAASATLETEDIQNGDMYIFDGSTWIFQLNHERQILIDSSLNTVSENPVENRVVASALNTKADLSVVEVSANKVTVLDSSCTHDQYPSAKVVYDEMVNNELVTARSIITLQNQIAELNARITQLVTDTSTLSACITTLDTSLSGAISQLVLDTSTINARLNGHDTSINSLDSRVSELENPTI